MAERSWSSQALVLSLSNFGEGHREALLLTPERGLVHAAVFGGAKSRLRSLVSPWQSGTIWCYTDPVKKSTKITDFDVTAFRQGIRENLVRTWCASLCAEIIVRTHASADWTIVNAFLDGIAVSGEDECRRGLLRFLWRLLVNAGINPDIQACSRCSRKVNGQMTDGTNGENRILFYSPHEQACVCASCVRPEEVRFPLSASARIYLSAVEHLKAQEARALPVDPDAYAELRNFLFFLLNRMVDGNLHTLETGEGIL
jgi:DNA repair protein RecO (recombination protein O)